MIIRSYQSEDQKKLIQLWVNCGLVVPHNNPVCDIDRKLADNPDWLLVAASESNEIVGSCMVGYDGHRGWIYYLAVDPDLQRQGLATKLMKRAEELLKDVGCPKINLMVRSTNTKVIDFYNAIGFQTDHVLTLSKRLKDDPGHSYGE